jgi:hypothetical protein
MQLKGKRIFLDQNAREHPIVRTLRQKKAKVVKNDVKTAREALSNLMIAGL